ncbi:unnamed protein product [Ilex paraguariensis]|uniref:Uncharacterized protein n=1 Tax=Ilex paraguariensis TaxID=185542 RepID=A0ABC8R2Y3_9AQUA
MQHIELVSPSQPDAEISTFEGPVCSQQISWERIGNFQHLLGKHTFQGTGLVVHDASVYCMNDIGVVASGDFKCSSEEISKGGNSWKRGEEVKKSIGFVKRVGVYLNGCRHRCRVQRLESGEDEEEKKRKARAGAGASREEEGKMDS